MTLALCICMTLGCISLSHAEQLLPQEKISVLTQHKPLSGQCNSVAPQAGSNVEVNLERTFFDAFNTLDLYNGSWIPHYGDGYDVPGGKWHGYFGSTKRTLEGNKEQQIYVDPRFPGKAKKALGLNPFKISDGILQITADKTPIPYIGDLYGYQYYSGVITTRKSFTQQYGYFEMRARMPAGQALWPAFWMLSADNHWPPELDVVEVLGHEPSRIHSTVHWSGSNGQHLSAGCKTSLASASRDFHLYGALWTPTHITYFIDRKPFGQVKTPASLHKPMYMLLNLAVGGSWGGMVDDTTPLPAVFEIDWVAAYKMGSPINE